jgi:hypothetical protein
MDPYSILDIPQDATIDETKRAFRKLAQKWHPDLNKASNAHERYCEIRLAYERIVYGPKDKPSSKPNTPPQQESDRPRTKTSQPKPPPQKPYTQESKAQKQKKYEMAAKRRQEAEAKENERHTAEKFALLHQALENRDEHDKTLKKLEEDFTVSIERERQLTASRLEEARIAYERLVRTINNEREEAIHRVMLEYDREVVITSNILDKSEREFVAKGFVSDRDHEEVLQQIMNQYIRDIASNK